jgi:hypothetical protein
MYQKLLEHKETKGYCLYVLNTLPLGRWLRRQRWIYRHGILRNCFLLALMIKGKKGGAVGVRDAPSGQPPRKKRKVEDLDNDLAAMIHDEGEEGIDDINANGYGNDNCNCNAHTSGCVG